MQFNIHLFHYFSLIGKAFVEFWSYVMMNKNIEIEADDYKIENDNETEELKNSNGNNLVNILYRKYNTSNQNKIIIWF